MNLKNRKGFTLMELVVSTAIMGTLAAFAVPTLLETQQDSYKNKTLETINSIGAAIIQKYMEVAPKGSTTGNAIAALTLHGTATVLSGGEDPNTQDGTLIVEYKGKDAAGDPATLYISYDDIFSGGTKIPASPFGGGYTITVPSGTQGYASWSSGVLNITKMPSFTIADEIQSGLSITFSL